MYQERNTEGGGDRLQWRSAGINGITRLLHVRDGRTLPRRVVPGSIAVRAAHTARLLRSSPGFLCSLLRRRSAASHGPRASENSRGTHAVRTCARAPGF